MGTNLLDMFYCYSCRLHLLSDISNMSYIVVTAVLVDVLTRKGDNMMYCTLCTAHSEQKYTARVGTMI